MLVRLKTSPNEMINWQHSFTKPLPFVTSQIVWKATTQLGLAAAISASKKVLFVARYKVRGNFGDTQAYINNVKPKGKVPAGKEKSHKITMLFHMDQESKYYNCGNTYVQDLLKMQEFGKDFFRAKICDF